MSHWNFIVILRPTRLGMLTGGPTPAELEIVSGHFSYYSALVAEGKMLLAGRSLGEPEQVIGIGIFHAESMAEAEVMMNLDPAIVAGVMTAEVQPYGLALLTQNPHRLP